MSTYNLEEQEKIAELKSWWKQYGNLVLTTITAALAVFAAWNAWNWYGARQSGEAAALYEVLEKASRANDAKATREAAGTLLEKYPRTSYGPLAALVSAKVHYQAGDLKTAKAQLQWAIENGRSEELKALARLRLAHVLVDEGAPDEALKTIAAPAPAGFESLFESLRGDIYLVQKKPAEARAAYKAALDKADKKDSATRQQLQIKIDALGEGA
jgi:predicted negative regulator of RcsB-dependent stress response